MNKPKILYDVLMRLQPYSTDHSKITSIRDCWKVALGIENEISTDSLKLRVKLADSVYEIADRLEATNSHFNDRTWKNDLVNLLTSQAPDRNIFFNQLQKIYPHVSSMIALQITIWEGNIGEYETLDIADIESIKQKTNDLINELINNKNIDSKAKSFVIKQLRKILEVIDHYQIYGNEGIIEIIEESIGHTFVNKSYQDFMKSEKSESWKEYLADLSLIVATSESIISIGTTLKNLLP